MNKENNSDDSKEYQKYFSQAIEQYTERYTSIGEEGMKDLQTLSLCNIQNMIQAFKSQMEGGLTQNQVQQNGRLYGVNQYKKRHKKSLLFIFKEAVTDQMLIVLMVSAVISIVVEYSSGKENNNLFWVDGVSILIAVMICTLVATISNYQKQRQFDELDKMTENTYNVQVIRDGRSQEMHRSKIVPGDIIQISSGMEIPADCILLKGIHVIVNESAITGESQQIQKNIYQRCMEQKMLYSGPTPIMISGSNIVSGQGLMMAVVVGKESRAGKNYQLIFSKEDDEKQQQTPLQEQLQKLAAQIGYFGIASAILIFTVLFLRLFIQKLQEGGFSLSENLQDIIQYLIISVTVVVVAIPEGLPLAVTLTLAYSMKAMHYDKILVRKLASCETMGSARYICSDKTGTITQNKMNVAHVLNMKGIPIQQFYQSILNEKYLQKLSSAIFNNTTAVVQLEKGSQTEIALLKVIRKIVNKNEVDVRREVGLDGYFKRLPFDSSRKRITTGMTINNQDIIFMSGASEQILQACQSIQNCYTGEIVQISKQIRDEIEQELEDMENRGLRTVSISFKQVDRKQLEKHQQQSSDAEVHEDELENIQRSGFTLLGIFGIEDPPREESKQAIEDCKRAGIKVLMITGDSVVTAANIAQQVGIISENDQPGKIMVASQFMKQLQKNGLLGQKTVLKSQQQEKSQKQQQSYRSVDLQPTHQKMRSIVLKNEEDQQKFEKIINNLSVMARSNPEHKYILVDGINKLGHIVGVTGDGANDAPALMRADIGLAMGISGTQVSKSASDIILLDDNFHSIVKAVVWGRNVYLSIRKFLQFQLTVNVIAVCITLISAAIIRQSIFAAVQMLWVNLIMDSLAALALATEPPNRQQMLDQQPNSPDERLITKTMLKHIIGQTFFQFIILLILIFEGPRFIPQYRDAFDDIIGSDLSAKYYKGIPQGTVADGKLYSISGHDDYIVWFEKYNIYSRHFTFIYNSFVFLQIFNFICCRRVKDQISLFNHICSSKIFWIIVTMIVIFQIVIITFGGQFFQVYNFHGLTLIQWVISVGIGALTIPVSILLRLIPFPKTQVKDDQRKYGIKANQKIENCEPAK